MVFGGYYHPRACEKGELGVQSPNDVGEARIVPVLVSLTRVQSSLAKLYVQRMAENNS